MKLQGGMCLLCKGVRSVKGGLDEVEGDEAIEVESEG